jgi:hypothetical protein
MALTSGQLNINIGAPNSPQGSDSLYVAFGKIQNNFVNVFTEATAFTSANITTGSGLSNSTVSGTVTLVNTGVTSIVAGDTNIVANNPNGTVTLSLATSLSGLVSVAAGNVNVSATLRSANITSTNSLIANTITASNNVTANNLSATSSTNAGVLLKLTPQMTPPASPTQGTIYYDGFLNVLRVHNGLTWGNVALS